MVSDSSVNDFERSLPTHYRKWVRSGISTAAIGYLIVALARTKPAWETMELYVGLICALLLLAERNAPKLSGYAALLIIWLELMSSIAMGMRGMASSSTIALPLWIVAVALFFGRRAAWFSTGLTAIALLLSAYVAQPFFNGSAVASVDVNFLVVAEACVISAAWLVTSFMDTLIAAVKRDSINASRAAQLVEKAPDAMLGISGNEVVAFNALAETYLGLKREEILGKPLSSLALPLDDCEHITDQQPRDIEVGERTLEVRFQKLEHEGQSPETLFVLRDVSGRARAEKRNRDLQEQLEHAQRLEAIGQLAGGIAHDFNNLLTAFSGTAELLLDSSDEQVQELARGLESASDRGAALTRQLLTFARREVVQARVINLSQVIEGSRTLLTHLLSERLTLDFDLAEHCLIRADPSQIEQVLLNLGANARDATEGPGTLLISTRVDEKTVTLIAQDTGRGMDEETQKRIFEPFFTTKPRDKGTGLGLSTVHGIVTHWEGTLEVNSQLGEGTTFTIRFPRKKADETKLESLSRAPSKRSYHGRVLLVEDNEAARDITERLLRRSGFDVTTATSAEEALALCRDGFEPQILVSDVVMRGLTGVDLAERLREERPGLPVLFISGYVDDVLRDWPFDTTQDLLLKPFAGDVLIQRIQRKLKESNSKIRLLEKKA